MRILIWTRLETFGMQCQQLRAGQPWTLFQAKSWPEIATGIRQFLAYQVPSTGAYSPAWIWKHCFWRVWPSKLSEKSSLSYTTSLKMMCGPIAALMHPSRLSCWSCTGMCVHTNTMKLSVCKITNICAFCRMPYCKHWRWAAKSICFCWPKDSDKKISLEDSALALFCWFQKAFFSSNSRQNPQRCSDDLTWRKFSCELAPYIFQSFQSREGVNPAIHADGLTFWTDGLYKSTYHRVRAPREDDHRVRKLCSLYPCNFGKAWIENQSTRPCRIFSLGHTLCQLCLLYCWQAELDAGCEDVNALLCEPQAQLCLPRWITLRHS